MTTNPFVPHYTKAKNVDGVFSPSEVGLGNRKHGLLIETLECDVTPTGAHYSLNHFDVPARQPMSEHSRN